MRAKTMGWLAVVGGMAMGASAMLAAAPASDADRAFVAKVSQGGAYEVEAGKVAAMRGRTPVVKNFGVLETHDHEGVGAGLKRIAGMTGVPIAPGLNAEFSARLAKLKAVPDDQFDAYYVNDMKQIHNNDEGAVCAGVSGWVGGVQGVGAPDGGAGEGASGVAEYAVAGCGDARRLIWDHHRLEAGM